MVGMVKASDPKFKDEYIVLNDHLGWNDTEHGKVILNGANDNTSGVAELNEIGRQLALTQKS